MQDERVFCQESKFVVRQKQPSYLWEEGIIQFRSICFFDKYLTKSEAQENKCYWSNIGPLKLWKSPNCGPLFLCRNETCVVFVCICAAMQMYATRLKLLSALCKHSIKQSFLWHSDDWSLFCEENVLSTINYILGNM